MEARIACQASLQHRPACGHGRSSTRLYAKKSRTRTSTSLPEQPEQQAVDVLSSLPQLPAQPEAEPDFWEGERWELLGKAASVFLPVAAALAVAVGLLASQTYNEGATVFLDNPKGPSDTARLIPAEQLQQQP